MWTSTGDLCITQSMFQKTMRRMTFAMLSALCVVGTETQAQIIERPRPAAWKGLVDGGRFMDRFLPMQGKDLRSDVWGDDCVKPRYVDNGIEDAQNSYWGGNILRGKDGKYHLFVCGWPEDSEKGHFEWPNSIVYHAVCDNPVGPFKIQSTIGPGHNPEAFQLADGRYVVYVINSYYIANDLNGRWEKKHFDFDARDRRIIEGLSNLTFARRSDGSFLMVCRGGGVWVSQTGVSPYQQVTDRRIYPAVEGAFEDPVVWKDHVQYHVIVNDWYGRIAYYLRSPDGVRWVVDSGEAYMPGIAFHSDGTKEDWFKYERIKIFQDKYGRAIQANFAVVDVLKADDKGNDNHSSKNIAIPLNPGLLIDFLNKEVPGENQEVVIRIKAEDGFDPARDLDFKSLRFGAPQEVDFGRGAVMTRMKQDGRDVIVAFDSKTSCITEKEFAPKLLGKNKKGQMVFGYSRVPWIDYEPAILSARKPVFKCSENHKSQMSIRVDNLGLKRSLPSEIKLEVQQGNQWVLVDSTQLAAVDSYGKLEVSMEAEYVFEPKKSYRFRIVVADRDRQPGSVFEFDAVPRS